MPKFSPNKCLHILIADCNFPDCAPYFYNKVRAARRRVKVDPNHPNRLPVPYPSLPTFLHPPPT